MKVGRRGRAPRARIELGRDLRCLLLLDGVTPAYFFDDVLEFGEVMLAGDAELSGRGANALVVGLAELERIGIVLRRRSASIELAGSGARKGGRERRPRDRPPTRVPRVRLSVRAKSWQVQDPG